MDLEFFEDLNLGEDWPYEWVELSEEQEVQPQQRVSEWPHLTDFYESLPPDEESSEYFINYYLGPFLSKKEYLGPSKASKGRRPHRCPFTGCRNAFTYVHSLLEHLRKHEITEINNNETFRLHCSLKPSRGFRGHQKGPLRDSTTMDSSE